MKLEKFLQDNYGYNPEVKNNIQSYINMWKSWYKGNVRSFHNYYVFNGNKRVPQQRYTMNMAKEISEEWADILWSEKCKISMKDEKSQNEFNEITNKLDLYSLINQTLEKAGALGTVATVTSVYDIVQDENGMYLDVSQAKTRTDIVNIDWIFPISWTSSLEITECAFGSTEYINGIKYVVCSVHKLNDKGNYVIYNHLFKSTKGNLQEIKVDNTINVFDTLSNVKWFAIFKPSLTNNLFSSNPFGIPYYANAIDNLKAVDMDFDALKNEINDGRKRIFARDNMFKATADGMQLTFDPNDTTIYQLPDGVNKDDLIQSDSDTLRTAQIIESLNTNLNILGNKMGFNVNHYTYDGTGLQTATAVISSNSKMFRHKRKLEIGYESSIFDLVKAICYASTQFGTYNINTEDMVIQFDDSIIEDKESESNRALRELNAGVIGKVEYRMKIFGETDKIAKKKIIEIQEENKEIEEILNDNEDEEQEVINTIIDKSKNKKE